MIRFWPLKFSTQNEPFVAFYYHCLRYLRYRFLRKTFPIFFRQFPHYHFDSIKSNDCLQIFLDFFALRIWYRRYLRHSSKIATTIYCDCDFRKKEFFCAFLKFAASSLKVAFLLLFQIVYETDIMWSIWYEYIWFLWMMIVHKKLKIGRFSSFLKFA